MFRRAAQAQKASFPAQLESLREIQGFIRQVSQKTPLSAKEVKGILLAVEEVCTNIIRHSYLYSTGSIAVTASVLKDRLVLTIADQGRQFDPTRLEDRSLDKYVASERKGGLGFQLVKKLVDEVQYGYQEEENRLTLIKKFPGAVQQKVQHSIRPSFKTKIATGASLLLLAAVTGFYLYSGGRIEQSLTKRILQTERQIAEILAQNSAEALALGDDLALSNMVHTTSLGKKEIAYLVIADTLDVIWADAKNPGRVLSKYQVPRGIAAEQKLPQKYLATGVGQVYHFAVTIKNGQDRLGTVHMGIYNQHVLSEVSQAKKGLLTISLLVFLVGLACIYLLSRLAARPFQELKEKIRGAATQSSGAALPVEEDSQVGEIIKAFNDATAKIKQAQQATSQEEWSKREAELAEEIRQALIPKEIPKLKEAQISSLYKVAREIGGDYFDFVRIDQNNLGIAVADIAGKGVSASMVMAGIRTALRLEAKNSLDPAQVLDKIDFFISPDMPKGMFVTMLYAIINLPAGEVRYASAGHNPALICRQNEKKLIRVNPKGLPLGLKLPNSSSKRESATADINVGDLLFLYTDGIVECLNSVGEQFGYDRLLAFIHSNGDNSVEQITQSLDKLLQEFSAGTEQKDDITLVVFKPEENVEVSQGQEMNRLADSWINGRLSLEDTCQRLGIDPRAYRKHKRRVEMSRAQSQVRSNNLGQDISERISPEMRNLMMKCVIEHPEYGPVRVRKYIASSLPEDKIQITQELIYQELLALGLSTPKSRYHYIMRTKGDLKPEWAGEHKRLLEQGKLISMLYRAEQEARNRMTENSNREGSRVIHSSQADQTPDQSSLTQTPIEVERIMPSTREAGN